MKNIQPLSPPWVPVSAAATVLLVAGVMAWTTHFSTFPAEGLPISDDGSLSANFRAPSTESLATEQGDEPLFMGLGDLPGGIYDSVATGVSADGSVVVGDGNSDCGAEAFRWMRKSGIIGLGFTTANGISADGTVVVGTAVYLTHTVPVRWTQRDGIVRLGELPSLDHTEATAISADSSVIVGVGGTPFTQEAAFIWTSSRGMARLGLLPEDQNSAAYGVSADGTVVVGSSSSLASSEACRWTRSSELVRLGTLPGDATSEAHGVSADGSVVVGTSGSGEAFRWTKEDGMVGLGTLPSGSRYSAAIGVSADGSVVVGESCSEAGVRAFIWDAVRGMRSVREALVHDLGLGKDVAGWTLTAATAISGDGRVIAGVGINPHGDREAWIATNPSAPAVDRKSAQVEPRLP